MNPSDLLEILQHRESDRVEFKSSITPDSVHDMVALLNTQGGYIFYGVDNEGYLMGLADRDAKQKISDLMQAIHPAPKTKIHLLSSGNKKAVCLELAANGRLYSHRQKVWVRVGANNRPLDLHELFSHAGESALISFDQQLSQVPSDDLQPMLVKEFLDLRKKHRNLRIPDEDPAEVLARLGYARNGRLTYGGLLLFGRSVDQNLINNRVHVVLFKDRVNREVLDSKEFRGNLPALIDSVLDYLHVAVPIRSRIRGRKRLDVPEVPIEMLRELVTNALLHRNYVDANETKIMIAPQEMEIINPGSFLSGVTPDKPRHKTRNNVLSQYLFEAGRIEKYGSGIPLIFRLAKRNRLQVDYHLEAFATRVTIRKKEYDPVKDKIVRTLMEKSPLSAAEVASLTGLSRSTLQRRIVDLIDEGRMMAEGRGKRRRYSLST